MGAVATIDTRGAEKLSVKKMKVRTDAIDYLNKHVPWISRTRQENRRLCERIDEMMPLINGMLGESGRRTVGVMRGRYADAVGKVGDDEVLSERVAKLRELHDTLVAMGRHEITGGRARVLAYLLADSEALVCKKMGSAHLRLYASTSDYSCLCLAKKHFERAMANWEAIDPQGLDYAKVLYWLAITHYMDGKFGEALKNVRKCVLAADGRPDREWLQRKALALQSDIEIEVRERLLR